MFIFYCISICILHQFLVVQCVQIGKIQQARIVNISNTFQFNCSTCICQCLRNISPTSSSCCYVNCFIENDTCQVIVSSRVNSSTIVVDQTSVVYKTNCFDSSTTESPSNSFSSSNSITTGPSSLLHPVPNTLVGSPFASTIITTTMGRTSDVTSTKSTTTIVFLLDQLGEPMPKNHANASTSNP